MIKDRSREEEEKRTRDESRLATIAYWLARYRDHGDQALVSSLFTQMVEKLETEDAKSLATAWYANNRAPMFNSFADIGPVIRQWAENNKYGRTVR